jgi:hypothetical protein
LEINVADSSNTIGSKITYFISHYAVYIGITLVLLFVGTNLYRFFFPAKESQISKPTAIVVGHAEKGSITQTSTQIELSEKPWEVGAGVGGFRYDNKDGYGGIVFLKRKW